MKKCNTNLITVCEVSRHKVSTFKIVLFLNNKKVYIPPNTPTLEIGGYCIKLLDVHVLYSALLKTKPNCRQLFFVLFTFSSRSWLLRRVRSPLLSAQT